MRCWARATADAAELAYRSFHRCHECHLSIRFGRFANSGAKTEFQLHRYMNAPRYYEMLQQEFTRLHRLGWTFRQIAGALDISERTVTAWREELDLPRRPRGRKPRKPRG